MVLARVSYLPLSRLRFSRDETLGDVSAKLRRLATKDFAWPEDEELTRLLGEARRFRDMRIEKFVLDKDESIEKQFSAVTIWAKPRVAYISFFGTDDSLAGWKEDFNMVFMDEVPAQTAAVKYLKSFVWRHPFSRVYLGGHSKGGNLAIYAAVTASDFKQRRIKKVFNFDGPGLRKKLAERDAGRPVTQKIESYIPQDSLIGRLLEHREKITVVQSNAKPLLQHDLYTWEIDETQAVRSKSTKQSDFNDRLITRWIENASEEEREIFVEACFEILKKSQVGNPMQLALAGAKKVPALVGAYKKIDKSQRKAITEMVKKLIAAYYRTWRGE